jgi:hypothetical protein
MNEGVNGNIKVIDNFLSKEDHASIYNLLLENFYFPWYFNPYITSDLEEEKSVEFSQFTHNFYQDFLVYSDHFSKLLPIVKKLQAISILRLKANLTPYNGFTKLYGMHTDFSYKNTKTAVYYVNTNNGATVFEDGTKVDSVENRIVMFNCDTPHGIINSTNVKARCVININYVTKEN